MTSPFPKITYQQNAEVYKLLASPKRLEILNTIRNQEVSVENLIEVIGASKANVSQHLAVLRQAGLVHVRREGQRAYYKLIDPRIIEPCSVLHELRQKGTIK